MEVEPLVNVSVTPLIAVKPNQQQNQQQQQHARDQQQQQQKEQLPQQSPPQPQESVKDADGDGGEKNPKKEEPPKEELTKEEPTKEESKKEEPKKKESSLSDMMASFAAATAGVRRPSHSRSRYTCLGSPRSWCLGMFEAYDKVCLEKTCAQLNGFCVHALNRYQLRVLCDMFVCVCVGRRTFCERWSI
jgi:hypothetical protein